jgi:4-hydroxy-2-oxoheptanedioate aldolase
VTGTISLKALLTDRPAFGCWLGNGSGATAELMALVGYDVLVIDMEHGSGTLGETADMLRAAAGTGARAIVRAPANDAVFFKQLLDLGPDGVMVPMIETAEEARAAVAACRYPPRGIRGWAAGVARASRYGLDPDYTAEAADRLFIACQIETVKGVGNAAAIAAVEGVDMLFVGRNDLAASAGHILQLDHPEVDALLAEVEAAGRAAGRLLGTVPSPRLGWRVLFERGFRLVVPSTEVSLLRDAARAEVGAFKDFLAGRFA